MTASHSLSSGPRTTHLLLSLALGQFPIANSGRTAQLPWRLRRESLGRSTVDKPRDKQCMPEHPSAGEAPPELTVADVMTRSVVSVSTATPVSEIANVLAAKRISAAPVIDVYGSLVGIVSEGDLIRRAEIGTQRRRSWWSKILADIEAESAEYVRTHGGKARHVMTPQVVTATSDMTLVDAVDVMEKRRLKRLPVVDGKRLVGIVSRSDLVRDLARHRAPSTTQHAADDAILRNLTARVKAVTPSHKLINVSVHRGNADIAGLVDSAAEREAILVAAESTPGIHSVQDRMIMRPRSVS